MTESSQALDRLRAVSDKLIEPELYVRMIEELPDAMVVVDDEGVVRVFNRAAELVFGYHRSEILGLSVDALVPDAVRDSHAAHRAGFMSDPRSRPMGAAVANLAGRHKDGHSFPAQINLAPIVSPSGIYVMAVVRRIRSEAIHVGAGS